MLKHTFKNTLAASAILAIVFGLSAVKSANAVIFNFVGTCSLSCSPTLGPDGSLVTGNLDLAAGAVAPSGLINGVDILSLSFNFATLGPLSFIPAFVGPSLDPVGILNLAGDAIVTLTIFDSLGQFFTVDFSTEFGTASWTILDQQFNVGTGTGTSFTNSTSPPAPTPAPEPASMAMFLFSIGSMALLGRRRRRLAGFKGR